MIFCARPTSSIAAYVGWEALRVKRRRMASVDAVRVRIAVAYLIIWSYC